MTMKRVFRPYVGQVVDVLEQGKPQWESYRAIVAGLPDEVTVGVRKFKYGASNRPEFTDAYRPEFQEENNPAFTIPLSWVKRPVYWQEHYDISVSVDKLSMFLQWMDTVGLALVGSLDLGNCHQAWLPGDTPDSGHGWRYGNVIERLTPEQCKQWVTIRKLEHVYDASVPCECRYCKGTGMRNTGENSGLHAHTWNVNSHMYSQEVIPCWVCGGSGVGREYLNEHKAKSKRHKEIKEQLERQGWKLIYRPYDRGWDMQRETVVRSAGL